MSFDFEKFLPYRLYQAAEKTSQAFYAQYRAKYDLKRTEWRVLFNIGNYGPISAVDISRRTGLEKTKISRAVQRLEDRGWVERVLLEQDRRRHNLKLTSDGQSTFSELNKMAEAFNQQLWQVIGADRTHALIAQLEDLERSITETDLS